MKKALSAIVALVMLFSCFAVFAVSAEEGNNREFIIYKVSTPPTIDGVIEDGEYPLVTAWPDDTEMPHRGDYVANIEAYFYMCYDDEYIYYAVKTECDDPHIAVMDNGNKRYIFNAHHIMTLIIPDDPSKDIYPGADEYDWTTIYNGGYCYEWTMIYTSDAVTGVHEANMPFYSDHFGNLISGNKATYATKNADGWDYYEVKIPWSSMSSAKQSTPLTAEEGTIFGFDFSIGLTNVSDDPDVIANDGYDGNDGIYKGNYLYLAGCYAASGVKALNESAIITLGGDYNPIDLSEEESSAPTQTSAEDTSKPDTPPTGDNGFVALAIISVISLGGAIVVKRR